MTDYEATPLWIAPPPNEWPVAPTLPDEATMAALHTLVLDQQRAALDTQGADTDPRPGFSELLAANRSRTFAQHIEQNPRHRELYFAQHMKRER